MIIKKPYAFIIKHFRLIHLLLLIPMIYLVIKTRGIITFFSDYVANNYRLSSGVDVLSSLASNYINIFMYLAVIIILIILIFLTIVLKRKNKPVRFYNISIIYYLALFVLITISFSVFKSIENDTLDAVFARIIRDLATIIHYSQYIFIIFMAVRGIGFNIKQFDFKSDLDELEISSEDNEEVEFLIGIDTYKTKRSIRRFFRELKYYYKENKFIFIMISVIIVGVIGTLIYMNEEVYQRVYHENETLASGYLNYTIKDSYISNLSQNGTILKEGKYYVILQIEIANRYREDHDFNYINYELTINNEYFRPSLSMANYFTDYGTPYNGTPIKGNTDSDYILVYEIDEHLINQDIYLTVYSHYDASVGGIGTVNNRISLDPTLISDEITITNANIGTNIDLSNSTLGNSEFAITDYQFTPRHEYTYEYCPTSNNCYSSTDAITVSYGTSGHRTTLLVLDYILSLDNEIPYTNTTRTYRSFFDTFTHLEYTIGNQTNTYSISLKNPSTYSEKAVIEVPQEIADADNVILIVSIRNQAYRIRLF